jgi:hypothetical protein
MGKGVAALLVFMVVGVSAGSTSASASNHMGPPFDMASGGGTYLLDLPGHPQFEVHFSFNARTEGSQTSTATGRFFWNDTVNEDYIKGRIICLVVDGGEAFFVSEIVDSNDPGNIGFFAGVQVFDSGLPGREGNRFHFEFVSFPFPDMCSLSEDEFAFEVVKGSIRVHDAA